MQVVVGQQPDNDQRRRDLLTLRAQRVAAASRGD